MGPGDAEAPEAREPADLQSAFVVPVVVALVVVAAA